MHLHEPEQVDTSLYKQGVSHMRYSAEVQQGPLTATIERDH
jgi:hypothetical protein